MVTSKRSVVTFNARAKLLSLLDGKFGVYFSSQPHGSFDIQFLDSQPTGIWIELEKNPKVFADLNTLQAIENESAIDFDFKQQEFLIRRTHDYYSATRAG